MILRYNLPMAYRAGGARFSICSRLAGILYKKWKSGNILIVSKIGEKAISRLVGLYLSQGVALGLPAHGQESR